MSAALIILLTITVAFGQEWKENPPFDAVAMPTLPPNLQPTQSNAPSAITQPQPPIFVNRGTPLYAVPITRRNIAYPDDVLTYFNIFASDSNTGAALKIPLLGKGKLGLDWSDGIQFDALGNLIALPFSNRLKLFGQNNDAYNLP